MRRRWKIAIGVVGGLVLLAGCAFTWMVAGPPSAVTIAEPGASGRRIDENGLFANYFPAPGPGRRPAILLLGGSEGGLGTELQMMAVRLQGAGYNVLHLAYHNAPGQSWRITGVKLETFFRGIDWLKARPEVDPNALALVGYSKGAEAALLTSTHRPDLKAVVAGMPSSVAWDGMSFRSFIFGGASSWSHKGEKVASLSYDGMGPKGNEMLPLFANVLKDPGVRRDAEIPVERFGGRLLLVCGAKDNLWPSCPMARQIEERAKAAGKPATQLLEYAEAGHGVMGPPLPADHKRMKAWATLGGTARSNAAARADSWPKIVAFLDGALKS